MFDASVAVDAGGAIRSSTIKVRFVRVGQAIETPWSSAEIASTNPGGTLSTAFTLGIGKTAVAIRADIYVTDGCERILGTHGQIVSVPLC